MTPLKKKFNLEAKPQPFSVSVRPKASKKKDHSAAVRKMVEHIRARAKAEGIEDKIDIKTDDGMLDKLGFFFMTAPEKFAEAVRQMEGVAAVEKIGDSQMTPKNSGGKKNTLLRRKM